MREIKFRAWYIGRDEDIKGMWSVTDIELISICHRTNYVGLGGHYHVAVDSTIIMQYTGLKDKNGKEIYEGDILRWLDRTYIVEQTSGGWNPFIDDMQTDGSWHYEIIGNIYENPELLEAKHE